MFKAILWDNDGVLVDTEHLYCEATRRVFAGAGITLGDDDFRDMFLTGNMGAWRLLAEQGRTDAEIARIRDERNDIYSTLLRGRDHAIDGVREVLQALHGRYAMGVVTSSRRDHFEIIHATSNLLPYFDFVLTREQYVNAKPDPEPYLAGIAKTGFAAMPCGRRHPARVDGGDGRGRPMRGHSECAHYRRRFWHRVQGSARYPRIARDPRRVALPRSAIIAARHRARGPLPCIL